MNGEVKICENSKIIFFAGGSGWGGGWGQGRCEQGSEVFVKIKKN